MDTRLDENETELSVLVLAVALEVLADGDGLEGECQQCLKHNSKIFILPSLQDCRRNWEEFIPS